MVRFFSFVHPSPATLKEICMYKIMVQHTSDSYGREYVTFGHYMMSLFTVLLQLEIVPCVLYFYFLWDHWADSGIFENGVLLMYTLEVLSSVANFISAYEESQYN